MTVLSVFVLMVATPPRPARAVLVTTGALPKGVAIFGDPTISDWEVARWMNEFFEDGSKGNGIVDSNIVMYHSQCYGGNWLDNFNNLLGDPGSGFYDNVRFTNTSVYSATSPDELNGVGRYGVLASANVMPGVNSEFPHNLGLLTKYGFATPRKQGPNQPLSGTGSTHVLVYAGEMDQPEFQTEINHVVSNYRNHPNATVAVLAGDGTVPNATAAATRSNLRNALMNIGTGMGPDSTFIMYVSDHGSRTYQEVGSVSIAPDDMVTTTIPMATDVVVHMHNDLRNVSSLTMATTDTFPPDQITVGVNAIGESPFLISLDDPMVVSDTMELPDPAGGFKAFTTYHIPVSDNLFFANTGGSDALPDPVSQQLVDVFNDSNGTITFEAIMVETGSIAQVPEPSMGLLLAGGTMVLLLGRRRTHLS